MPSSHSLDFKMAAVTHATSGNSKLKEVSTFLKINPKTLYRWVKRYKNGESLEPKKGYQKGHSHAIKDLDEFKKTVENSNASTRQEIVDIVKVGSVWSIGNALRKIGFVKKKPQQHIVNNRLKK
jgi:transposase